MPYPSKYKPEYAEQAKVACRLGARNRDLAEMFGVCLKTFYTWLLKHPELKEATDEYKKIADERVERALYERATGYSAPDTDIKVIDGQIVKTDVIKEYPPDPTSMIFWLKNRQPEKWRDRVEYEKEVPDDRNITINLVDAKKPE